MTDQPMIRQQRDLRINALRKINQCWRASCLVGRHRFLSLMRSSVKLKVIFALIGFFSCLVILDRLHFQGNILRIITFSSDDFNYEGMNSTFLDSYDALFYYDKQTAFLDSETRRFLKQSHFYVFPSKYKKVFLETLLEFDRIWRQRLNRTYVLYGGTLLGAYRHGQTVPWDDDIDILVDMKYNATIEKDLAGSKFAVTKLFKKEKLRKLFFTHNGTTTNQYGHWPFIDLFFFKLQKNGAEVKLQGIFNFAYPTKYMFPVIQMQYEGHTFLAPRCPRQIVRLTAGSSAFYECCSHTYNHKLDKSSSRSCISCSKLLGLFQFVMWARVNSTHGQKLTFQPHPWDKMATNYKNRDENWRTGPVFFMPEC